MYTLEKNELPQVLSNMFNKNTEFHSYPHENSKMLSPTKAKNAIFQQDFHFHWPKILECPSWHITRKALIKWFQKCPQALFAANESE